MEHYLNCLVNVKIGNESSEPIKIIKGQTTLWSFSSIIYYLSGNNLGSLEEELLGNGSANRKK